MFPELLYFIYWQNISLAPDEIALQMTLVYMVYTLIDSRQEPIREYSLLL